MGQQYTHRQRHLRTLRRSSPAKLARRGEMRSAFLASSRVRVSGYRTPTSTLSPTSARANTHMSTQENATSNQENVTRCSPQQITMIAPRARLCTRMTKQDIRSVGLHTACVSTNTTPLGTWSPQWLLLGLVDCARRQDGALIGAALPVGDLRALHHRDGPGGSRGREGLGPIPEAACQLPPAASSRKPSDARAVCTGGSLSNFGSESETPCF